MQKHHTASLESNTHVTAMWNRAEGPLLAGSGASACRPARDPAFSARWPSTAVSTAYQCHESTAWLDHVYAVRS